MNNKKVVVLTYAHLPEVRELESLIEKTVYRDNIHLLQWNTWLELPTLPPSTDLIINVGFAGMLNPNIETEEVYAINKIAYFSDQEIVFHADIDSRAIDFSSKNKIKTAALLTSRNPVTDQLIRERLYCSTNADLVDMEAYIIYELAKKEQVTFVSFKIISDFADKNARQSVKEKTVKLSEILGQTVIIFLEYYFNGSNSCSTGT